MTFSFNNDGTYNNYESYRKWSVEVVPEGMSMKEFTQDIADNPETKEIYKFSQNIEYGLEFDVYNVLEMVEKIEYTK